MYRTGDMARYLPDGNLEFLGRVDEQVKLRGYRIELSEIEYILVTHPNVEEAVVLLREDVPGITQLVAYLVGKRMGEGYHQILDEHLAVKLPSFMIPSAYVWMDEFPLIAHGKVDRKRLPVPDYQKEIAALRYDIVSNCLTIDLLNDTLTRVKDRLAKNVSVIQNKDNTISEKEDALHTAKDDYWIQAYFYEDKLSDMDKELIVQKLALEEEVRERENKIRELSELISKKEKDIADLDDNLTIKGVKKQVSEKGKLEMKEGKILATTVFPVTLSDYEVKIPNTVVDNIAETVDVTVDVTLEKYQK